MKFRKHVSPLGWGGDQVTWIADGPGGEAFAVWNSRGWNAGFLEGGLRRTRAYGLASKGDAVMACEMILRGVDPMLFVCSHQTDGGRPAAVRGLGRVFRAEVRCPTCGVVAQNVATADVAEEKREHFRWHAEEVLGGA